MITGWICCSCALALPFAPSLTLFIVLLWLLFFFGGFIIPLLIGWMLSAVPVDQRGSANSLAQFSYNAFGYMTAPFIYGLMSMVVDRERGVSGWKAEGKQREIGK